MAIKMPRYVRTIKGNLYYQRDIPTKLRHLAPKKTFVAPLGLSADSYSETTLAKAVAEVTESFELYLKMLTNSDPNAFDDSELDKAATELLRQRGLYPGQYVHVKIDPDIRAKEEAEQSQMQPDKFDHADWVIPEADDTFDKNNRGDPLTFQDKVFAHAYFKLVDKATAKPKTLDLLWQDYADYKDIDINQREGKRIYKRWLRWLSIIGNQKLAPNTIDLIHHALDVYIKERRTEGVKGSSIKREVSDVLSCLRHGSKRHRLGWVIEPPFIKQEAPKPKPVMTHEEQRQLVDYCLSQEDGTVAACVLLMLQGGMMPSEVMRLEHDRISLNSTLPHIVLDQETKTQHTKSNPRRRVIPIVIGGDYIASHIDTTLEWLNRTTESDHSHRIKTLMKKATGNDKLSGHCCRHTFEANAFANGVDSAHAATIAGWSGSKAGVSDKMLRYGAEGLSQSEVIRGLFEASKKLHRHLLVSSSGNVVDINKVKVSDT